MEEEKGLQEGHLTLAEHQSLRAVVQPKKEMEVQAKLEVAYSYSEVQMLSWLALLELCH